MIYFESIVPLGSGIYSVRRWSPEFIPLGVERNEFRTPTAGRNEFRTPTANGMNSGLQRQDGMNSGLQLQSEK